MVKKIMYVQLIHVDMGPNLGSQQHTIMEEELSVSATGNAARCKRYRNRKKKKDSLKVKNFSKSMHYFINAFDYLCQKTDPVHDIRCPVAQNARPQISVILPLYEPSILRMAVGSHKEMYRRRYNSLHGESLLSVMIPPTFAILFLSGRTIHGGGPSNLKNTRVFSIYNSEEVFSVLENKNYRGGHVTYCLDGCQKCRDMTKFKAMVGGGLYPAFEEEDYDVEVGELLYHYNLKQHGFCVLKVSKIDNLSQAIITEIEQFEKGGNGVSFRSMGQEENTSLNNRKVLNVGGYLNEVQLLADKWKGDLNYYYTEC